MSELLFDERKPAQLAGQILRVFDVMRGAEWLSLLELRERTGDPIASISAQLRNLRKPEFGSHTILRRRREPAERGLHEYHLVVRHPKPARAVQQ
jgi:hypothetical protein